MKKTQLVLATLVAAGLASAPFAVQAKSYKHKRHHATMSSTTTGANMKSSKGTKSMTNPSSQGNAGPGTNQGGSTSGGSKY